MDSSNDLVIGQATHFDWPMLEPYARSLVRSGFAGKKVLMVKGISQEAREHLLGLGFILREIPQYPPQTRDFFQGAGRYKQTFYYLKQDEKFRYVLCTDTRDLVFQTNPSAWLEQNLGDKKLVASSEYIPHTNEAWNASNIKNCYTEIEAWISDKIVYCSGVIVGESDYVADLCLSTYYIARHLAADVHGIDQAAYNIVMHQKPWKDITRVTTMQDAFSVNLQTCASPMLIETYRPWLQDTEPEIRNGIVYPKDSQIPFSIVHQHDRHGEWSAAIRRRYCIDPRL